VQHQRLDEAGLAVLLHLLDLALHAFDAVAFSESAQEFRVLLLNFR
jgi:ABC-type transporter Mla MlaB component